MSVTRKTYKVGQTLKLSAAFADENGAPADPTTIVFKITEPDDDATVTTYNYPGDAELVRDGLGAYHVEFTIGNAGTHCYSFAGTGFVKAYNDEKFDAAGACA